jgi:hypothetical protein
MGLLSHIIRLVMQKKSLWNDFLVYVKGPLKFLLDYYSLSKIQILV